MDIQKTRKIKIIKSPTNKPITQPITPDKWTLQNKKIFPNWINQTFLPYKLSKNSTVSSPSGSFQPFPYQKFLRDYLQNSSPYRGLLLYHGLGSGKTCSSILIAENLKNVKNILILMPASLKANFINEGLKFCGDPLYRNSNLGNSKIDEKYIFVSYNAPNKIKQLDALGSLDNHVIIIEEVHNLISMMVSENAQGKEIYKRLMEAKNCKLVALSGTPLQNFAYETAILFNLLRGYFEETILNISSVKDQMYNLLQLEKVLKESSDIDIVSVNPKNKSISIYLKKETWDPEYKDTVKKIIDRAALEGVTLHPLKINRQTLFPEDEERFLDYFISVKGDEERFKNRELFKRRILGLVSYYSSKKEGFPLTEIHPPIEIEMSNYQYQLYELAREELERKLERLAAQRGKSSKKPRGTQKIPSNFRVYSRQFSNFVFPEDIPRPFRNPALILSVSKKNNNNENSQKELQDMMQKESEIQENEGQISKDYKKRMDQAVEQLKKQAKSYLTPNGLTKYSPKMKAMLEQLQSNKGLALVYSNFRKMEGIEVFSQILQENGWTNYNTLLEKNIGHNIKSNDKPNNKSSKFSFAIFSGEEDFKIRNQIIKLFTSRQNKDGEIIKALMITRAGAEGLDLKNIRQVLIMEPYWNDIRIEQVIGRAVRRNSHVDLPINERKVDVYIYQSILSKEQKEQTKEKISTDQYLMEVAHRKKVLMNDILGMMKEMAVDCVLNSYDNEGNIKCFTFGEISDQKELAYLPKINEDLIYSNSNSNRQTVERTFTPAIINQDNLVIVPDIIQKKLYYVMDTSRNNPLKERPVKSLKVALDLEKRAVYDLDSVKDKKGTPILIGNYNNKSIFQKL
jgi:superfamily II DNA or RNA helicase